MHDHGVAPTREAVLILRDPDAAPGRELRHLADVRGVNRHVVPESLELLRDGQEIGLAAAY